MKVFERYTLKELQDGIGEFLKIKDRRSYNKMYSCYESKLRSNPYYVKILAGGGRPLPKSVEEYLLETTEEGIIRQVHVLETSFKNMPLFVNSHKNVRGIVNFRLRNGR